MVRKAIVIIILSSLFISVRGQQRPSFEVSAWMNYRLASVNAGFDPGGNGAGMALGLHFAGPGNTELRLAGELGAAGVGFYGAGVAGFGYPLEISSARMVFTPGLSLLQGAGLFNPGLLYMWGVEQTNILSFSRKNGSFPGVLLSARYYGFPGYSVYSDINHFLDLRIGLNYRF